MKWVKFGGSRHFLEYPLRKWPGILHAAVSWASLELSRLWSQFVDFSNFGTILTSWSGSNLGILVMLCGFSSLWCPLDWNWSYLGFLGIIWRTCGSKRRGGSGGIFPTLCVEFCLVYCEMCSNAIYCTSISSGSENQISLVSWIYLYIYIYTYNIYIYACVYTRA